MPRLAVLDVFVHTLEHRPSLHSAYPGCLLLELPGLAPTFLAIPPQHSLPLAASTALGLGQPALLLADLGVSLCLATEAPVEEEAGLFALLTLLGGAQPGAEPGASAAHLGAGATPLAPHLARCLQPEGRAQVWQASLTLRSLCGSETRLALTLKATPVPQDLEGFFAQHLAAAAPEALAQQQQPAGAPPAAAAPVAGREAEAGAEVEAGQAAAAAAAAATAACTVPARVLRWGAAELGSGSASAAPLVSFGPSGPLLSGITVPPGATAWQAVATATAAAAAAATTTAVPSAPAAATFSSLSLPQPTSAVDELLCDLLRWRDLASSGARARSAATAAPAGGSPGGRSTATAPRTGLGSSAAMVALQGALLESGMDQAGAARIARTLGRLHVSEGAEAWRSGQSMEFVGSQEEQAAADSYLPFGASPAMERLAAWLPKSLSLLSRGGGGEGGGGEGQQGLDATSPMHVSTTVVAGRAAGGSAPQSPHSPRSPRQPPLPRHRPGSSSSSVHSMQSSRRSSTGGGGPRSPVSPAARPLATASHNTSSSSSYSGSASRREEPVKGVRLPLSLRAKIAALAEERRFSRGEGSSGGGGGGEEASNTSGALAALLANLTGSSSQGGSVAPPQTPPRAREQQLAPRTGGGTSSALSAAGFSSTGGGSVYSGGSSSNTPRSIPAEYLEMLEAGGGMPDRRAFHRSVRANSSSAAAESSSAAAAAAATAAATATATLPAVPALPPPPPPMQHSAADIELPNRSSLLGALAEGGGPGGHEQSSSSSSSPRKAASSSGVLEGTQFSSASEVYSSIDGSGGGAGSSISGGSSSRSPGAGAGAGGGGGGRGTGAGAALGVSASVLQVTALSSGSSGSSGGSGVPENTALFVSALSPSPKKPGGLQASARKGAREEFLLEGNTSMASLSASGELLGSPAATAAAAAAPTYSAAAAAAAAAPAPAAGLVSATLARAKAIALAARSRVPLEVDDVPDSPELDLAPRHAAYHQQQQQQQQQQQRGWGVVPSARQAYYDDAEEEEEEELGEVSEDGVLSPPKVGLSKPAFTSHLQAPYRGGRSSTPNIEEGEEEEEEEEEGVMGYGLGGGMGGMHLPRVTGFRDDEDDSPDDDF